MKDFKNLALPLAKKSWGQLNSFFSKSLVKEAAPIGSVGIDIGTHSIKIIRLVSSKDGLEVLGFAVEKAVDKNYREAMSKALSRAGVSAEEKVAISVAGQGVVSRYIEVPKMNKSELESSMKFEIEKYVPFSLSDIVADYAVVSELKDKAKMSILVAAAKNDLIQKKYKLAKEFNLNLKVVDLDCLALANFFTEISGEKKEGACFGIINIGKSFSSVNILIDDIPHLSRDIFIGGDDITKKMSEVLEVDYAEAEKLKIDPQSKHEDLLTMWDPVLNNLAGEIRVSLDYFEAQSNRAVEKIFISGGSSRLIGIEGYLEHLLGVAIKKVDYADRLKFHKSVNLQDFKKDNDLLTIALGVALPR